MRIGYGEWNSYSYNPLNGIVVIIMLFKYKDIDFNIDERYVTEENVKSFFSKIIPLTKEISIFEIVIPESDFSEIFINKKGVPDAWDKETINFVNSLQNNGYDVLYTDEDYGEGLDVILLYDEVKP